MRSRPGTGLCAHIEPRATDMLSIERGGSGTSNRQARGVKGNGDEGEGGFREGRSTSDGSVVGKRPDMQSGRVGKRE
jgi:hypothetical protein